MLITTLTNTILDTFVDVTPIIVVVFFFQLVALRRPVPHLRRTLIGFFYVLIGLSLFLVGLREALFPLGEIMAQQLTAPSFIAPAETAAGAFTARWWDYGWVYAFAASIGFATTIAEPSLIAVAIKARQVSGGAISIRGLRVAVALGVGFGVALGSFRIVTGTPLVFYILGAYIIVIIQTVFSARTIIPLAYDSGGVTTSTVTVPLVAALGIGLATTIPGRSPLIDGFGLIAFASVFPIISVLGYAQLGAWASARRAKRRSET